MKQMRQSHFSTQDHNEERILKKIKLELGQGDWVIDYNISGSIVSWKATKNIIEGKKP